MSVFDEVDKLLEEDKTESGSSTSAFEEVDRFIESAPKEVGEYIDPISDQEALAKNLIVGFHDYVSLLPGEWHKSDTIDEWKEEVDELERLSPDVANSIFLSSTKYVSDAVAVWATRGVLNKYKYTAGMVRKVESMLAGKKYKEAMIAGAVLAEAENAMSSVVHDEEYTPGAGAAFGAVAMGTLVTGRRVAPAINRLSEYAGPIISASVLKAKKVIDDAKDKIDILFEQTKNKKDGNWTKTDKPAQLPSDKKKDDDDDDIIDIEPQARMFADDPGVPVGKEGKGDSIDLALLNSEKIKQIQNNKETNISDLLSKDMDKTVGNVKVYTLNPNEAEKIGKGRSAEALTEKDIDILGLDPKFDYIAGTKAALQSPTIKSELEKGIGRILDARHILDETSTEAMMKQASSKIDDLAKKYNVELSDIEKTSMFNPSELRQFPSMIKDIVDSKDGIQKALDNTKLEKYMELAPKEMRAKYAEFRKSPGTVSKEEVKDIIDNVFNRIETDIGYKDIYKAYGYETKAIKDRETKLYEQRKKVDQPSEKPKATPIKGAEDISKDDLVQLHNERNLFNRSTNKIMSEYKMMDDAQKAEFKELFKKRAGLDSNVSRKERISDELKKKEESALDIMADISRLVTPNNTRAKNIFKSIKADRAKLDKMKVDLASERSKLTKAKSKQADDATIKKIENSIKMRETGVNKMSAKIKNMEKHLNDLPTGSKRILSPDEKVELALLNKRLQSTKSDIKSLKQEIKKPGELSDEAIDAILKDKKMMSIYLDDIVSALEGRISDITHSKDMPTPRIKRQIDKSPKKQDPKEEQKIKKQEPKVEPKTKSSIGSGPKDILGGEQAQGRRTKDVSDTLKNWEKHVQFADPKDKELMQRLISAAGLEDMKITFTNKRRDTVDKNAAGVYVSTEKRIEIYANDITAPRIVLHETIHAATYHSLRKDKDLQNELQGILDELIEQTGSNKYWTTNTDELLAEFFSHYPVREHLKSKEVSMPDNIITKIVNFIRKVLNMSPYIRKGKVEDRLNKVLDDILGDKPELTVKQTIDQTIKENIEEVGKQLKEHKVFEVKKDGTINVGSFKTDMFKNILNDVGVSNKATVDEIARLRKIGFGMQKQRAEESKIIAKAISQEQSKMGYSDKALNSAISGRAATAIYNRTKTEIDQMSNDYFSKTHKVAKLELDQILKGFGQSGTNSKLFIRNTYELEEYFKNKGRQVDNKFLRDFELLFAKNSFKGDLNRLKGSKLADILKRIEMEEDAVLRDKRIHGYMGFTGEHDFNLHVATSNLEINHMKSKKGWNQVGDSNTFYQLNLEPSVSNGIIPSTAKPFQGTIIRRDIQENMRRLDKEGIKYSVIKKGNKIDHLRLFPSAETSKVLGYSTDPSKLMARKYRMLGEQAIRLAVSDQVSKSVKDLFSRTPAKGMVKVDDDMALHYKNMLGYDSKEDLYVSKEFSDMLVGVKETLLYKGDNRLGQMMERTYKDLFKRFKRAVTTKSPSSIVNNYVVIPSMLKMAGVPVQDIPKYMKQAHQDYADYIAGMEKYMEFKIAGRDKAADAYLQNLKQKNIIAEMMENGALQSSVDDAIIQLGSESDMIHYASDKLSGFGETGVKDKIERFIEMHPDSAIGKFFLNKFVMADIVGRASMYTYLRKTKGLDAKAAEKGASEAFVDFSRPLPESIRVLEEYGVPFIGWMYRMQMPIFRMMKENPTDTATVIASYYALQAMFDGEKGSMQDGYAGDVKIDSWFLHNSFMDTGVIAQAPIIKGDVIPHEFPKLYEEIYHVSSGDRNFLEIFGLNIRG